MRGTGRGAHTIYLRPTGELVVDWYDFGEDAPYESANMIVMTAKQQVALARTLGLALGGPAELARTIADRFNSYFAVRAYLDAKKLPYDHEVDFEV